MEYSPIYKRALGAVFSAGYRPDRAARYELQRACGYGYDVAELLRNNGADSAMRALESLGYPIAANPDPRGFDLLQPAAPIERPQVPLAGDILQALAPWNGWHNVKRYGLQGPLGIERRGHTIANAGGGWHCTVSVETGRESCLSMGNGGPASFGYLDSRYLEFTGETARLRVWSWIGTPCANGGFDWLRPALVWNWTPAADGSDFLGWQEAEQPAATAA